MTVILLAKMSKNKILSCTIDFDENNSIWAENQNKNSENEFKRNVFKLTGEINVSVKNWKSKAI